MCFSFVGWFCYGEWFCWVSVQKSKRFLGPGAEAVFPGRPGGKIVRGCGEPAARSNAQSPRIHRQHREHVRTGFSGHGSVLSSDIKKKHNRTITRNPHKINRKTHFFLLFRKKTVGTAPRVLRTPGRNTPAVLTFRCMIGRLPQKKRAGSQTLFPAPAPGSFPPPSIRQES